MDILSLALFYALNLTIFLLPGLTTSMLMAARYQMSPVQMIILSVISSATFGYVAFWVYFASKLLGEIFSYALVVGSTAVAVAVLLKRHQRLKIVCKQISTPFVYVFVVGLCYLYLFFVFGDPFKAGADLANARFFKSGQPGDNLIPLFFAQKVYDRQPVSPICCGDWLSSDRPPLQAGIFLLERPLRLFGNTGLHYQVLGTALQCFWVCAVWCLLTEFGTRARHIGEVLAFLVFSGFLFYNSVYVWPKLLAATFIIFIPCILFTAVRDDRPLTMFEVTLAATSMSLALMAHPGSVFSLPALLLLLIARRKVMDLRRAALATAIMLLFVVPWGSYQKFYDPPGNRLLKMHLAGVNEVDSRSTWQALYDAYTSHRMETLLRYKWENIRSLVGPEPLPMFGTGDTVRFNQREYIWNAIGIVNAGWLVTLVMFFRRDKRLPIPYPDVIAGCAIVNLASWCIAMFGPGQTITTHSSYADIIFLSIALLGCVLTLPRAVIISLLALEVLGFFALWIFFRPASVPLTTGGSIEPKLQLPLLIAGLGCGSGLLLHFCSGVSAQKQSTIDHAQERRNHRNRE